MRHLWHWLRERTLDLADWLAEDKTRAYDLTALAGLTLVALGVWLIFPPAALMIVGLGLVGVGVLAARVSAGRRRRAEEDREGWRD